MIDNKLLNSATAPDSQILNDFAMTQVVPKSLIIKNGVLYVLGGVSSGKSTLISKLIKVYDDSIEPIILCFYTGFAPDETTTYNLSNYNLKRYPYFMKLPTPESMMNFFNRFRHKRLKYSELLMLAKSLFRTEKQLFNCLCVAHELFDGLSKRFDVPDYMKRIHAMMQIVADNVELRNAIYQSDYVMKQYATKHKISYDENPYLFISNVLVSLSKALNTQPFAVLDENQKPKPVELPPMLRFRNNKTELIPTVSVFDDVAQFPLLTTERSNQWTKDLFAETRRWMNTFVVAAQRHNLLNKSLRALTHTFFIGYSLIDDDLPRIAKEMPSNVLSADNFLKIYRDNIKPFSFLTYNNKYGFNFVFLKK